MDKLLWEQALDDLADEAHGNGNDWDAVIAPRVTAIKEYFETIASLGRIPGKADEDRDNAIWNFEEQRRETARLRAQNEQLVRQIAAMRGASSAPAVQTCKHGTLPADHRPCPECFPATVDGGK